MSQTAKETSISTPVSREAIIKYRVCIDIFYPIIALS